MARILSATLLAFVLAAAVGTGPASAGAPHYRAELASPPAKNKVVARELVWRCAAAACVAPKSSNRPASDCAALADKLGPVRSFTVAGEPLDAAALEKCNARAR